MIKKKKKGMVVKIILQKLSVLHSPTSVATLGQKSIATTAPNRGEVLPAASHHSKKEDRVPDSARNARRVFVELHDVPKDHQSLSL
jgi:hypothetical protein